MAKKNAEPEMEQEVLHPDFKPVKNERVHKAAKHYYDLMLERKAAGDDENDAHDSLLNVMLEEGLEHYEYKGVFVDVNIKKACKVKIEGAGKASAEPATTE